MSDRDTTFVIDFTDTNERCGIDYLSLAEAQRMACLLRRPCIIREIGRDRFTGERINHAWVQYVL